MGYIVQWYDQATKNWRKFGTPVSNPITVFDRATQLYKDKERKITVRVRQEETVWYKEKEV